MHKTKFEWLTFALIIHSKTLGKIYNTVLSLIHVIFNRLLSDRRINRNWIFFLYRKHYQFYTLLESSENNRRIYDITSMSQTISRWEEGFSSQLNLETNISTFFFKFLKCIGISLSFFLQNIWLKVPQNKEKLFYLTSRSS
jgi:hypothetical protein